MLEVPRRRQVRAALQRHIAHPPQRVWRALTEPDQLRQWFPTDIEGERKPGAKIRFAFREPAPRAEDMPELLEHDPEGLDGEFTEFDPPRRLGYTWGEEDCAGSLSPPARAAGSFTHTFTGRSGIPHPAGPRKKAARTAAGWDVCLASLRALLEDSDAPPADLWPLAYDRYIEKFG